MITYFKHILKKTHAVSVTEYAVLIGLLSVLSIVAALVLGRQTTESFENVNTTLEESVAESQNSLNETINGTSPTPTSQFVATPLSTAENVNVIFIVDETSTAYVDNGPLGWLVALQDAAEVGGNENSTSEFADNMRQLVVTASHHYIDPGRYPDMNRLRISIISMSDATATLITTTDNTNLDTSNIGAISPEFTFGTASQTGTINYDDALNTALIWFINNGGADPNTYNAVYVFSSSPSIGTNFASISSQLQDEYDADVQAVGFFDVSYPTIAANLAMNALTTIASGTATRLSTQIEGIDYIRAVFPSMIAEMFLPPA